MEIKNIAIAILVAYVVIDVSCAFILRRKRPVLFNHMLGAMKRDQQSVLLCLAIGVAAGVGAYYLAMRY